VASHWSRPGAALAASVATGPSSSHSPYVLPAPGRDDVRVVSLLTVGDDVPGADGDGPGYQMVGIPDGLGVLRGTGEPGNDGDGTNGLRKGNTFIVLMNHELRQTDGIVREHGAVGSFVSKWTIDRRTLAVVRGEDLIRHVVLAPGACAPRSSQTSRCSTTRAPGRATAARSS